MYFDGFQWIEYDVNELKSIIFDKYYDGSYPFPYTYSMAVTPDGNVWMGMSRGILRINPESLPVINHTKVESEPSKTTSNEIFCYPNPFNPSTIIEYSLPENGHVTMTVYNVSCQVVVVLKDEYQQAGNYSIIWNASDKPSGLYFCTLKANGISETRKMVVVK